MIRITTMARRVDALRRLQALLGVALLLPVTGVYAGAGATDEVGLSEVVVTAQRRGPA